MAANSSRSGVPFSSSSKPTWMYDVFLSFRGADTRRGFIDHLYAALRRSGVNVFIDDMEILRGNSIAPSLLKAIEESKISIVLISENYASSSWCLDELVKISECKMMYGQKVWPVFYNVEPSDVRHLKGVFAEAFGRHEIRFKDNLAKVGRWRRALTEAANLSGWNISNYGSEVEVIRSIVEEIKRFLLNPEVDAEDMPNVDDVQLVIPKVWQVLMKCIANEEARILKELFLYCCSLFPAAYEFRKDEVVQLWIAEGFIVDKYAEKMEDTGLSYFNYLESEGYFLLSRSDFGVDFDSVSSVTCNSNNLYKINTNRADVSNQKSTRGHYSRGMDPDSVSKNSDSLHDPLSTGSISQHTVSQVDEDLELVDEFSIAENMDYTVGGYFGALDMVTVSGSRLSQFNDLRAKELVFGYTASELDYYRAADANLNGASATIRHLSFMFKDTEEMNFRAVEHLMELRTLLLLSDTGCSITHVPRNLFYSLKNLRTLKLRGTLISELPSSIRNVKELRYLDVSYTPITRLPESVTYLHNLQTLKLRGCVQLHQLPKDLEKLVKLRHIELDIMRQLDSLPANVGRLTNLQTLSAFLVGKDEGCSIGQLKNLNDLKGALCISGLENVMKVEEAQEASLVQKKCLDTLELRWSFLLSTNKEKQEEIFEWLEPHDGLKELQIKYYGGSKLPTWISDKSFSVLVAVTLYRCTNCVLLPSMGQLPALKVLSIIEMNEVSEINDLFFRNGLADDQAFSAFPKLETLEIDIMLNLIKWKEIQKGDLPSLLKLTVVSCPELVILPSLSSLNVLKKLEFRSCPKLQPSNQLPDSLDSLIIVDCPQIKEWFHEGDGEEWSKKHRSIWLDEEEIKF